MKTYRRQHQLVNLDRVCQNFRMFQYRLRETIAMVVVAMVVALHCGLGNYLNLLMDIPRYHTLTLRW